MNFHPSLPTSYEYIHFSGDNMAALDLNRAYTQTAENLAFHKPNGLWLSITGIHDWEKYCLKNNQSLDKLKHEFQVRLKPRARILILYNDAVFTDFKNKYAYYPEGIDIHGENYTLNLSVAWERIIADYQGIVVPAVLPKLYNMGLWYDTWCCTSGCIWDLQAIEKAVKLA
jgi:hypothetical protein